MAPRPRWLRWALLGSLVQAISPTARGLAQDAAALADARRELMVIQADVERMRQTPLRTERLRSSTHVEERLTDGELFLHLEDYLRAAVIFTDIVDNYPDHQVYPEALFLLGESLYQGGDYLGARDKYRELVSRSGESSFARYQQRALGRLLELAIHLQDFDGVDEHFARFDSLAVGDLEPATAYFRAKYLYARAVPISVGREPDALGPVPPVQDLTSAQNAFEQIAQGSPYYAQALYFRGVMLTLQGRLAEGLGLFQRVVDMEAATDQQRTIRELALLALGRIHYERSQLEDAVVAYEAIPRDSDRFDSAQFELAWVQIRMGRGWRAEQALELLEIAVPESPYIPDARLLRGNLLLREGRLDDAALVFDEVVATFGPIREDLDRMVANRADLARYFRELVSANLDAFDVHAFLPASARQWMELGPEMERAMDTLADLSMVRELTRETANIVERLSRALGSKSPVNVFSDLRTQVEFAEALRNRLARVRQTVVTAEDKLLRASGSAEAVQIHNRRVALERRFNQMATTHEGVVAQADEAREGYTVQSRELNRLEVELMGLNARIVAIDRFVHEAYTEPHLAGGVRAYEEELQVHRSQVAEYEAQIRALALDIESGQLQSGVGDDSFRRDAQLRQTYRELVQQERAVLQASGQSGAELDKLLADVTAIEADLDALEERVHNVAVERATEMKRVLAEEQVNLDGYRSHLADMEQGAEDVIGGIAHGSFLKTRGRFYDLEVRAEVGGIDVAWAEREEHRMRLETLTRERNSSLGVLDAEFSEIMDQGAKP